VALSLIRATGPIFATSANVSDQPDTLGADEVLIAFATDQDALAAVVDGGAVPGGVPSTVLDLSVTPARILRAGPVTAEQLAQVLELEA
jgi:tRNA A37 threonylcarbamoyladenosine synthetase subunit TsaC/SUA5/YrdC